MLLMSSNWDHKLLLSSGPATVPSWPVARTHARSWWRLGLLLPSNAGDGDDGEVRFSNPLWVSWPGNCLGLGFDPLSLLSSSTPPRRAFSAPLPQSDGERGTATGAAASPTRPCSGAREVARTRPAPRGRKRRPAAQWGFQPSLGWFLGGGWVSRVRVRKNLPFP